MSKPSKSINTGGATTRTEAGPKENASIDGVVDDVFDLPIVDENVILIGAAADATGLDEKLKDLPRILRVALLINHGNRDVHDRLVADIEALHPALPLTAAFATTDDPATALALAKELDRCAVADAAPELRHIADCVRLLCLPMQKDLANSDDYRRVTQTLMNALGRLPDDIDVKLAADIESFCIGWAMIPALQYRLSSYQRSGLVAANHASTLGDQTATHRVAAAEETIRVRLETRVAGQRGGDIDAANRPAPQAQAFQSPAPGQHQRVVAQLSEKEMKNTRFKELLPQSRASSTKPCPWSCRRLSKRSARLSCSSFLTLGTSSTACSLISSADRPSSCAQP